MGGFAVSFDGPLGRIVVRPGRFLAASLMVALAGSACTEPDVPALATQGQPLTTQAVTKLLPDVGTPNARYGRAVGIDGNTTVIGEIGTVRVYELDGTVISPPLPLVPAVVVPNVGGYGSAVAIDGDTIVVGAPDEDSPDTPGAAYVFVRTSSGWVHQATLSVPGLSAGATFGFAVAISGDTVVVGAPMASNASPTQNGSAYVFVREADAWSLQGSVKPSGSEPKDRFGYAVDVQGDQLIVGAPTSEGKLLGLPTGRAFVYERSGSTWDLGGSFDLPMSFTEAQWFGASVSLDDPFAVVGGPRLGTGSLGSPTVRLYERNGNDWTDRGEVIPSNVGSSSRFGRSVSLEGSLLAVGAPDDDQIGSRAGAVYVFERYGSGWTLLDKLVSANGQPHDMFGQAVAVSGHRLVAGVPGDDTQGDAAGAVWLYAIRGEVGAPCTQADGCLSGYCVDGMCCDGPCGDGATNDCEACSVAAGAETDGTCTALTETACDDGDPCTESASCDLGACVRVTAASDGFACPGGTCQSGVCIDADGGTVEPDGGMGGTGGSGTGGSGTGGSSGVGGSGGTGTSGAGGMTPDAGKGPTAGGTDPDSSFYGCGVEEQPRGAWSWSLFVACVGLAGAMARRTTRSAACGPRTRRASGSRAGSSRSP
jgi:hypothetical protein